MSENEKDEEIERKVHEKLKECGLYRDFGDMRIADKAISLTISETRKQSEWETAKEIIDMMEEEKKFAGGYYNSKKVIERIKEKYGDKI